jgi:hypothetical protein
MSQNDEDENEFYDSESEPSFLDEDDDDLTNQMGNMSILGERSFNASLISSSGNQIQIYAVQFSNTSKPPISTNNRIFLNQDNAKKLCKEDPENRRFKSFKSFQEAYAFSYENQIETGQAPSIDQVKASLSSSRSNSSQIGSLSSEDENSQNTPNNKNTTNNNKQDVEKLPFSAPKKPEINELKSFIEKNMFEKFRDKVMANPRFLISSGDSPIIFQLSEIF